MVVSFHSLEDRIAKQFIQACSIAPESKDISPFAKSNKDESFQPSFKKSTKKNVEATKEELRINSRSRSAKLRSTSRTHFKAISPEIAFIQEIKNV